MLAKWKIELVSFLSSLSLVSVGFSAWNLSSSIPVIETVSGTVQTDYVIKTDDYVYFSKDDSKDTDDGIILPEFNEGGFINKDKDGIYSNVSYATMTLYLTVDGAKCNGDDSVLKANQDDLINIYCDITLSNKAKEFFNDNLGTFALINNTNGVEIEPILSSEDEKVGYTLSIKNYDYKSLESNNGQITISISIVSKTQSDIYKILYDEETKTVNSFIFHTEINGVKNTQD